MSDGSTEYVVVDEATEGEWSRRLVNTGVQIWTKCVDPRLITAAQHTVERLTSMPGDFSSTGYDETLDAVLIQTNLDADLVRRSISADAPEVPFNESTLRIVYVDSGCRGVGLDATIAGSPTDPRIVWLRTDRNKELNLVWPPGWFARFNPQLEVIDSAGSVRYREGDPVSGGCVTADGSTLEIDGE